MMVKKIDEYVCSDDTRVQKWLGRAGYDIVVIKDSVVVSTAFASDKLTANKLFEERVIEIEEKLENRS